MSSGHYCDGCAQAYYKCVCNKPQEKVKEQTIKMNERIRELAEKARIKDHWSINEGRYLTNYLDEQKFAELIIAECLNQVREQYLPVLEDELMMKDTHWDGYVQCGVDSYVAIREHFGVKE